MLKYAGAPFDHEHQSLRLARSHGIPVPRVLAARTGPGWLAMLMDDLGDPAREPADIDGARAAAVLHQARGAAGTWMARVDAAALAAMPDRIAARLRPLGLDEPVALARALAAVAAERSEGTGLPPYGLCHSEFHPTSLHIGVHGWHLLDLARAFTGPGLLDLASWHGTTSHPDPAPAAPSSPTSAPEAPARLSPAAAAWTPRHGRWAGTGSGPPTGSPSRSASAGPQEQNAHGPPRSWHCAARTP